METACFLELAGHRLFCVVHSPPENVRVRGGLVFVHPLLEEKKSAHRCLVETAREFSARGIAVFRFDLSGCGDSAGELREQSIDAWHAQIVAARQWFSERLRGRPVGLLGIRFGGTLVSTVAIPDSTDCVILWEPVTDGGAWLRERRRQRQVREMLAAGKARESRPGDTVNETAALDIDGFELSEALMRGLETLNPARPSPVAVANPRLILQIGPLSQPSTAMKRLCEDLSVTGSMPDLKALRAPPFWNRLEPQPCPDAAGMTLDWLSRIMPEASSERAGTDGALEVGDQTPVFPESDASATGHERPVTIDADRVHLTGVIHTAGESRRPAVMMLHGWGTYRIGPHRMFVHAARRFAAAGIPVLRFDFRGRGDSEGMMAGTAIETMIDDALAAWRQWVDREPQRPSILLGMCSGAKVAAALATRLEDRPAGMVFWSPEPPDAAQQSSTGVRVVTRRTDILASYRRKMCDPATWRKLLSGSVNWRLVHRALFGRRGAASGERRRDQRIYSEFTGYAGPRLLIDGGADPAAERARSEHRDLADRAGARLTVESIDGADHNFYRTDWETCVIERTLQWLLTVGDHLATPAVNNTCGSSGER